MTQEGHRTFSNTSSHSVVRFMSDFRVPLVKFDGILFGEAYNRSSLGTVRHPCPITQTHLHNTCKDTSGRLTSWTVDFAFLNLPLGANIVFGRVTRFVAIATFITHLWVSLIVAPWHQMVAHRPASAASGSTPHQASSSSKCSHCCDHKHGAAKSPCAGGPEHSRSHSPSEHGNHNDCPVCQVIGQLLASAEISAPALLLERVEFSQPPLELRPLSVISIEPTSRGPPSV